MTAKCASPIKGRVARLIKTDVCGVPVTGASSSKVTTEGFISIEYSPQYEEGQEFLVRKANGALCVNDKDPNELKRVQLTVNFCEVDPDAVVVATGEQLLVSSVGATGTGVAFGEGQLTARFSLEVWQNVAGAGACDASGNPLFVYWAFPNVGNAQVGDYTVENGASTFVLTAETKAASSLWASRVGAATWLDANVLGSRKHFLFNITTGTPPTAACGAVSL